jgi:hypothetical protein
MENRKILKLTLKKKWFDMILSGEKKEEYRDIKPYFNVRLLNKSYDYVEFTNGYGKDKPQILVEYKGLQSSLGIELWGAPLGKVVYIIKLGSIVLTRNIKENGN